MLLFKANCSHNATIGNYSCCQSGSGSVWERMSKENLNSEGTFAVTTARTKSSLFRKKCLSICVWQVSNFYRNLLGCYTLTDLSSVALSITASVARAQTTSSAGSADSPQHFDRNLLVHFAELMQGIETDRILIMIPEELLSEQKHREDGFKSAYLPNPKLLPFRR